MIRIMQFPGTMLYGGVGSVVMNIYRNIDRTKVQFDFCVPRTGEGPLDEEIRSMGGRIFEIPQMRSVGFSKYIKIVKSILLENGPYEAVHIHSVHMGAIPLMAAKQAKIFKRIYHVHSTMDAALNSFPAHQILEFFLKLYIRLNATKKLACGIDAGKYIYGNKDFFVINNAVDTNRFYPYPDECRNSLRMEYKIPNDTIVIGDVARFVEGKNIGFFVSLAQSDMKKKNICKFLMVGDGPLRNEVEFSARTKGCFDKFIFTGARKDVERFYNMMDVFCLPSLFEGLPVTMMEAQACGLPCLLSSNVTDEGKIGVAPFEHMDLQEQSDLWIEKVYSLSDKRERDAETVKDSFVASKYEIRSIAKQLEDIYLM